MAGNNIFFNPEGCIKKLFPECVARGEQLFYAPQGIEKYVITQHLSDVMILSYPCLIIGSRPPSCLLVDILYVFPPKSRDFWRENVTWLLLANERPGFSRQNSQISFSRDLEGHVTKTNKMAAGHNYFCYAPLVSFLLI